MWFNPIVIWLLKSPLHGMVSKGVMLVTVTGRKSGRSISTPANYICAGNSLGAISWRERKRWRNLRGGADVRVLLAGKSLDGHGHVIEEEKAVAQGLFDYYLKVPKIAKYVGIGLEGTGQPVHADCERLAKKMVMIRIELA